MMKKKRFVLVPLGIAAVAALVLLAPRDKSGKGKSTAEGTVRLHAGFNRPRDIAISDRGVTYVLDRSGWLSRLPVSGSVEAFAPLDNRRGNAEGIAAGTDGTLLLADTHNNRIVRFDRDGAAVAAWGGERREDDGTPAAGSLFWPCAVAQGPDGVVYTLEYGGHDRVQKWSGEGEWLGAWGRYGEGEGEFRRPSGIAVDPDGKVYVADSINNRIQVFDGDGVFQAAWNGDGSAHGRLACPYGVELDPSGQVHVLEFSASRVRVFTPAGVELAAWGGHGRGTGRLFYPWGFGIGPDGGIAVADTQNNRVVQVTRIQ